MAVEKSIDLTATGATIEEAVTEAVHRASLTLEGLTSFEVERISGVLDGELQSTARTGTESIDAQRRQGLFRRAYLLHQARVRALVHPDLR